MCDGPCPLDLYTKSGLNLIKSLKLKKELKIFTIKTAFKSKVIRGSLLDNGKDRLPKIYGMRYTKFFVLMVNFM